jgi:hypothetical protein
MLTLANRERDRTPTQLGEIVIEYSDHRIDGLGRRQFTVYWLGCGPVARGFEFGRRGQVFFTDPAAFTAQREKRGNTFRVLDGALSDFR